MILGITSHTEEYLDKYPECKTAIYSEIIGKTISKYRKGIGKAVLLGAMLSADPAHSQEVEFLEGCQPIIAQDGGEAIVCDEEIQESLLPSLLRLEIYGIPTYDLAEYTDVDTRAYYVSTLDNPVIGRRTGFLLEKISESTGYTFGWIDIPVITDVVVAKYTGDQELWKEKYSKVLSAYPALREDLMRVFAETGFAPGEEI